MMTGITDPIAFLDNAGTDWDIACSVIEKADELGAERRKAELKSLVESIGASVGNRVAEQLVRMLR